MGTKGTAAKGAATKGTATRETGTEAGMGTTATQTGTTAPPRKKASPVLVSKTMLEDQERPVCFICAAEHPPYWAVAECSHRVCSLCALRMRALYGNTQCPMCKVESGRVMVVRAVVARDGSDHCASFEALFAPGLPAEPALGMHFADQDAKEAVMRATRLVCPVARCREGRRIWASKQELKKHVAGAHDDLALCDVCLTHKKAFPFEYRAYTRGELHRHQRGDGGHPACPVCTTLFYSEDELNEHCRDRHEQCHLCRRQPGARQTWHRDYAALEGHFRREHYLCEEPLCLELKFVVFESELEFKAHTASMHLGNVRMQRSAQQQLRRLDTGFTHAERSASAAAAGRSRPQSGQQHHQYQQQQQQQQQRSSPSPSPMAAVPPPMQLTKEQLASLVYGDAIGDLAQRMQSLTLYEQRNVEFCAALRRDHGLGENAIRTLKEHCRTYQGGRMSAIQLVLKLDALVGNERLRRIGEGLLDLQLDGEKRRQLDAAIKGHLANIAAFPPLPATAAEEAPVRFFGRAGAPSIRRSPASASAGVGVGVLRIRPATVPIGRMHSPPVDPSRNPLALLGSSGIGGDSYRSGAAASGKGTKKAPPPPSFRQAIASSSTVGIVEDGADRAPALDEAEFPSLSSPSGATTTTTTTGSSSVRGNVFTEGENRNATESFVIGDAVDEFELRKEELLRGDAAAPSGASAKAPSRKKKGQVLLRYG